MDLPVKARVYIYCVGLLALAASVFYIQRIGEPSLDRLLALGLFMVLGFLSEVYATWIPSYGGEISSSIAIYLASLFIVGPALTVLLVFVTTLASEILIRWDYLRRAPRMFFHAVLFNVGQWVVTVAATGLVFVLAHPGQLTLTTAGEYPWAIAAFLCYASVNLSLVTGVVTLTERHGFIYALKTYVRDFYIQYLVLCTLALLLVVLYSLSIWFLALAIIPLVLVHVSFRSHLRLQTETRKTFEKISQLLDERDHYTAVHSSAVAELAVRIGQELDLSQGEIEKIDIAARVHDIGKIAVPDAILLKHGRLTPEEWAVMKRHSTISAELIEGLEIYAPVADAVLHEHERWNGSGYPDGLRGEGIPLLSRIIAAADVYNALSTDRPYRKAFEPATALEMIKAMRGEDLDPQVADALLRILQRQPASEASHAAESVPEKAPSAS